MAPSADHLEVEVKFLVPDLAVLRQRLLAAGARLQKPRVFERNLRLDTPDELLLQRRQLLRIRQDTAVRITFKGDPPIGITSEAKVREELEIEASDAETAVRIFQRLGFAPVQVYEKYRETFTLGQVEIVLDEMPFGHFVELEGEEAALKETAVKLGLAWETRILDNYLSLMARLKAHHQLPFNDLTFANFEGAPFSAADILA